jgi:hypothetical protein
MSIVPPPETVDKSISLTWMSDAVMKDEISRILCSRSPRPTGEDIDPPQDSRRKSVCQSYVLTIAYNQVKNQSFGLSGIDDFVPARHTETRVVAGIDVVDGSREVGDADVGQVGGDCGGCDRRWGR